MGKVGKSLAARPTFPIGLGKSLSGLFRIINGLVAVLPLANVSGLDQLGYQFGELPGAQPAEATDKIRALQTSFSTASARSRH